jgi:hypothetical protein
MALDLLKFISKPALNRSLAEALTDGKWIEDIKGKLSIPALMQFCELWEKVGRVILTLDQQDQFIWKLTPNGTFSNKSAYHTLWLVPWQYAEFWCRRNIVSPLPNHLRNRHWTTDRLARRGLQHPKSAHSVLKSQKQSITS